jgi:hypothetical protein
MKSLFASYKVLIVPVLAVVAVTFVLLKTKSQGPISGDSIKVTSLYLHLTTNPGSTFNLLDPPSKLNSVFGLPLHTKTEFSEMYDGNVTQYSFRGISISYFEGHAISRQIKDATVSLGVTGVSSIKIGDNISFIQSAFPNSYALKEDEQIFVSILTPTGDVSDSFLVFEYDTNNIVTSIIIN